MFVIVVSEVKLYLRFGWSLVHLSTTEHVHVLSEVTCVDMHLTGISLSWRSTSAVGLQI